MQSKFARVFTSTTIWKHHAFFMVQLSHLYMTTGEKKKNQQQQHSLTIWTSVVDLCRQSDISAFEYAVSVQFSRSVVSDSLRPHGLQYTRPPCPSSTPRVYSNSCPLNRWCHLTISSSVVPFSSHIQSFPASGFFQWVSSLHQVAKVLEFQFQHQSFHRIFKPLHICTHLTH